jgi:hypothetical protein
MLVDDYRLVYRHIPPLPGSSLGPKDKPECASTLFGYIRRNNDYFALTDEHVVHGKNATVLGSDRPYKYEDGQNKVLITSPAEVDHNATLASLQRSVDYCQKYKNGSHQPAMAAHEYWEKERKIASNYDINFGYVYATSGKDRKEGTFRFDWAIIRVSGQIQNKVSFIHTSTRESI